MPLKKKKYNARFPAGRIKKIMQSDEEVGKVAQAVPIIISRTLELFVESMLTKTLRITNARNAKTLSPSHMKQCIMSESRFDFLRELVKNVPDINVAEEQQCDIYHERHESSEDGMSPVNGIVGNPNGGTREPNAGSSSSSHWKYTKQHSLDSNTIQQNSYSITSNNDNSSPINYSIKIDVNKPLTAKILRMDSTPATIGSNNNLASPIITADYLKTTKLKNSDTKEPVITFDFSKIPLLPSTSATAAISTSSNHSHSLSNILKLNEKPTLTIDPTKNEMQSQSSKMAQRPTSKIQLVKQLSHPYASSTITSNSSTLQSSSTSFVQSTSTHSTTLEMDEDYDNI